MHSIMDSNNLFLYSEPHLQHFLNPTIQYPSNMKKLTPFLLIFLLSCGPNAAEKARIQELREDSIRASAEAETRLKMELLYKLNEELKSKQTESQDSKDKLTEYQINLEVEKDRLEQIKVPQFLRSTSEREAQIKKQLKTIQQQEEAIKDLKEKIKQIDARIISLKSEIKKLQ